MRIKQKITINDIARSAGVSACTVSRAFNNHSYIKKDVRQKVIEAARKLNYTPKFAAVEEKIAILVNSLGTFRKSGYENILLQAIMKRTLELGYGIEVLPAVESQYHFERFVKGAVSLVYSPEATKVVQEKKGIPIVAINNHIEGLYHVCSDHRESSRKAVQYLVSQGHKKIGIVLNNTVSWGDKERLAGYKESMQAHDLDIDGNLIVYKYPSGNIVEAVAKITAAKATAVFAAGENLGIESVYALNLLNHRIPEDVSLISFENTGISEFLSPPQTTIDQNLSALGETAINVLDEIIHGKKGIAQFHEFPVNLIQRNTVKAL